MKICILVEGSYPYVTGGVASWVQMLIQSMPEHDFIIYSIGAEEKSRGQFKYKLPDNVLGIYENFLDSILALKNPPPGKYRLSSAEIENLSILINGGKGLDFNLLLKTVRLSNNSKNPLDIFMSFEFFDAIKLGYKQGFAQLPFTDFFWTVRSMLLPLFYILKQDLPEADIYHSVATGYAGVIGSLATTLYNRPLLLTEHGIYSREREEEIIKCSWAKGDFKNLWINFFYSLAEIAYQKSTQVFTLFTKNLETQVELGCDPNKIRVIPNAINIKLFQDIPRRDIADPYLNVGAIVRVVPIKDIITMLRSFAIVKQKVANAKFYIMGGIDENEEYYQECLRIVESLEIQDVVFTGSVNIREYLGKMDLLVLTSISEGQPLAILEGLAAKKPFVATDVGCCKELLYGDDDDLGHAGIVASVMDYESIARAIVKLAQNEALRQEMGENGYARIARYHVFEDFINKYKAVYKEVKENYGRYRV